MKAVIIYSSHVAPHLYEFLLWRMNINAALLQTTNENVAAE